MIRSCVRAGDLPGCSVVFFDSGTHDFEMRLLIALISLLLTHTVFLAAAERAPTQAEKDADAAFKAGNAFQTQGKFAEALAKYKEGLALAATDGGLLWNAGIAAQEVGELDTAVECWLKLRIVEPDNWRALAKLVQTLQAKGLTAERDAARKKLFELRAVGKNADLAQQEKYCREQFSVDKQKVMVFEYFELRGEFAVKYAFFALDAEKDNAVKFKISLGSYETTNAIMKESGAIKNGDRAFHLDGYFDEGHLHKTYAVYTSEPSYDEVRKLAVEAISGKAPVLSSSKDGEMEGKK